MKANPSPMSVADYCQAFNQHKIIVNEDYQRKDGLWTSQARSFFIESILLEFPIPKMYLYAKLDLASRQQIKEVVDGQQRTQALVSFYNNKQRLTSNIDTVEFRGLRYNQLDPAWQSKFLSYSLPIDQFSGAPEDEVREAFRRMNANNVPLNDEEQRNARYQGPFKWFVVRIADKFKGALGKAGVFSGRDLIRMSDLKLYSEVILAIDQGLSTVKGKQIDDLYKKYNGTFPHEQEYESAVSRPIEQFLSQPELHQPTLTRTHVFQSLILALMAIQEPWRLSEAVDKLHPQIVDRIRKERVPMDVLVQALREPASFPSLQEFIDACSRQTNVESSKRIRFIYLREALRNEAGSRLP